MKQHILVIALGLSFAFSPLTADAQPKDPKKPPTTPTPVPTPVLTPVPTPVPVPVSTPPQSSGKGEFKMSWGEAAKEADDDKDDEKPPPPGIVRLTWGEEAKEEESDGGLFGEGRGRLRNSRVIIVFVSGVKRLPLIRRIDFEARKKQLEKKRGEQKKKAKQ